MPEYWTLDGRDEIPSGLLRMDKGNVERFDLARLEWVPDQKSISHIMGFGTDSTPCSLREAERHIENFTKNGTPFRNGKVTDAIPPSPDVRELQLMSVEIATGKDINDSKLAPLSDEYKKVWRKLELQIAEGEAKGWSLDFENYQELD